MMRGEEVVSLAPKAIEMLLLLVRHKGEVLDKESLMKGLWPDTIVEENNLTVIVSALRKALGETRTEHRYIVTLSGRGYSFVAEVSETVEGAANGQVHSRTGESRAAPALNGSEPKPPAATAPVSGINFLRLGRGAFILGILGILGLALLALIVARALTLELTGEERKQVAKRYTDNAEAYQLYLRGRHFWNQRTAEGYKRAIECFEQATRIDPNYALAFAGLADSYQLLGGTDGTAAPKEIFPKAKAAAARALEIDGALAEAHTSLARVSITFDRDWPAAEREFKRAIELNPNYPLARMWHANYLAARGRFDEAFTEISLAQKLDPLSVMLGVDAGMLFYFARQYDRAIEQIRKSLELDRNFWPGHWYLGWVYEAKGMYQEALSEFEKAAALSGNHAEMAADLGRVYALSGRKGEARKALENLIKRSQAAYVSPCALALVYVGLGERDETFVWLQKGSEDRCWQMNFLKIDPRFDSLRTDPRFTTLLQRNNLLP
ncbi:MAG: tetratricopeptide repeat protein [Blastocatellia bacterium]